MKLLPDYPADSCMDMEAMMKQPDTKLGDTADADKWKTKVLKMLESRFGNIISITLLFKDTITQEFY